jgi:cytochrome c oxidase assembly protein subunit 15
MKMAIRWLGVVAAAGMFAVLIMGSVVTNTGSQQGCGRNWPLCQSKFIPQMAVKTAIEFSHRAVVGVETVLILLLAAGALYLYRSRREIRVLVPIMVGFLFLQAGLGAWAVMYPQEAAILALHFGVSLIAFASVLLTAVYLFEADIPAQMRRPAAPRVLRWYVWGLLVYSYGVVYSGAYVRHTNANLDCRGWPLCNGSAIPAFQNGIAQIFGHRVGAAILTVAIAALAMQTLRLVEQRPDLYYGSVMALLLVVLQAASGAVVVWTRVDLFSTLLHAALAGLLFGTLSYLGTHVLPRTVVLEEGATAATSDLRAGRYAHGEPGPAGVAR